ncbi:MAG: cryptochrome/photolyase family protein [Lysobacterales bacterium]
MSDQERSALLILGNQLFPEQHLPPVQTPVFMCEDLELCTYVRHHQQKIVLFLAAMREYADALRSQGREVCYHELGEPDGASLVEHLKEFVEREAITKLVCFEIEDHFFARRIDEFCADLGIGFKVLESPMFLTSRKTFAGYLDSVKKPFMADFYKRQRKSMGVLLDGEGRPTGGQWSFDEDNRKRLPKDLTPPSPPQAPWTDHVDAVVALVEERFADHPGSARDFWWPVTRQESLRWLQRFVEEQLEDFGRYQDALSLRSDTVFHSVLSPMMNLGLITPQEIVDCALVKARESDIPLNSLEGFVRQVIGWREFIRGIYQHFDERQRKDNFFRHKRSLTDAWFTGNTGIVPLDHAIETVNNLGWSHHIVRLMVVGNLMNLCEIEPAQVHNWFMVTHVDSSDWVMGPNVYGMALHSDGGIFATKPYICGSNYLLKMSDYSRGSWCDAVDGLYWRFIERHKKFFSANPRLSMMVRTLERMGDDRREKISVAAEQFLEEFTTQ